MVSGGYPHRSGGGGGGGVQWLQITNDWCIRKKHLDWSVILLMEVGVKPGG